MDPSLRTPRSIYRTNSLSREGRETEPTSPRPATVAMTLTEPRSGLEAQGQLPEVKLALGVQRRQGHPEKADAFWDREQARQQLQADLFENGSALDLTAQRAAACDLLEIGVLHLQGDGAATSARLLAMAPNLVEDRLGGLLSVQDLNSRTKTMPTLASVRDTASFGQTFDEATTLRRGPPWNWYKRSALGIALRCLGHGTPRRLQRRPWRPGDQDP